MDDLLLTDKARFVGYGLSISCVWDTRILAPHARDGASTSALRSAWLMSGACSPRAYLSMPQFTIGNIPKMQALRARWLMAGAFDCNREGGS